RGDAFALGALSRVGKRATLAAHAGASRAATSQAATRPAPFRLPVGQPMLERHLRSNVAPIPGRRKHQSPGGDMMRSLVVSLITAGAAVAAIASAHAQQPPAATAPPAAPAAGPGQKASH